MVRIESYGFGLMDISCRINNAPVGFCRSAIGNEYHKLLGCFDDKRKSEYCLLPLVSEVFAFVIHYFLINV